MERSATLVVFGGGGQLGRALTAQPLPAGWKARVLKRFEADVANAAQVEAALAGIEDALVVNASAYTAVDRAETESDVAYAVNRDGPGHVAQAAGRRGLPVIHISTDFVFDGSKTNAYAETDPVSPVSVYGASKLAGEITTAEANPRHVILRTAWVFSGHAGCFPRTIFRLLRERDEVAVVDDQFGCPTSAEQLAAIIMTMAPGLRDAPEGDPRFGMFHLAGQPALSRYDFARAVEAEMRRQDRKCGRVVPRKTDPAAPGARRPANSALDCTLFTARFALAPPDWRDILPACVRAYGEEP